MPWAQKYQDIESSVLIYDSYVFLVNLLDSLPWIELNLINY